MCPVLSIKECFRLCKVSNHLCIYSLYGAPWFTFCSKVSIDRYTWLVLVPFIHMLEKVYKVEIGISTYTQCLALQIFFLCNRACSSIYIRQYIIGTIDYIIVIGPCHIGAATICS